MFDGVLARGRVAEAVADEAWLRAMLDAEAALARARGQDELAGAIAAAELDPRELGRLAAGSGNPVVPLVAALRELTGPEVHRGATSQDILDTAAMLVSRSALEVLLADLSGAARAAVRLARAHRDTPMLGRTLLQPAVPVTFGLKAARWLVALDEAGARLAAVRGRLAVQLGGPAGTLAGFGGVAFDLVEAFAAELGLAASALPWHTDRTRIADLAGALGTAAGTIAKIARDVALLSQAEVGEVAEAAPGGSSAMPHKRNPVAAVSALAGANQAPGLVTTLLAAMAGEHERAAGAWQAEWRPLRELLVAVGSAASWLRACLEGLRVDPAAMARNLATYLSDVDTGCSAELVDRVLEGR